MVFPDYYFFAERRLVNHTIDEKRVKNLDDCELFGTWPTTVSVLTTKKIQKMIKQVTTVNLITPRIWNMTVTWQLMPSFIIVVRRWVTNRFFKIIALE